VKRESGMERCLQNSLGRHLAGERVIVVSNREPACTISHRTAPAGYPASGSIRGARCYSAPRNPVGGRPIRGGAAVEATEEKETMVVPHVVDGHWVAASVRRFVWRIHCGSTFRLAVAHPRLRRGDVPRLIGPLSTANGGPVGPHGGREDGRSRRSIGDQQPR
jgi:hypothetical protein